MLRIRNELKVNIKLGDVILATPSRDQEDGISSPVQANSSRDPIWKTHHKKGLVEWLKV
jgi:hypothetical protein